MHIFTVTSKHAFCELLHLFNAILSITSFIKQFLSGQLFGHNLLEENHKKSASGKPASRLGLEL
jgi:hypothetical protein